MLASLAAFAVLTSAQGGKPAVPQGKKGQIPPKDATPKRPQIQTPTGPPATGEQLRAWDGWKTGAPPSTWPGTIEPPTIEIPALRADDPGAAVMKIKLFVLGRTEMGPLGTERAAILPGGVDRLRKALNGLRALVRDRSSGRIDVSLAIANDEEAIDLADPAEAISAYLRPRINGGKFDAEDGVDRGPYSGILVVTPSAVDASGTVNGTPFRTLGFYDAGGEVASNALENSLLAAFDGLVVDRFRACGGVPTALAPNAPAPSLESLPTDSLAVLKPGIDLSAPVLDASARAKWTAPFIPFLAPSGAVTPPTTVYIEPDPARGDVLRYREPGEARFGGFTLPIAGAPAGKNLAFWIKVAGREGLALRTAGGETVLGPLSDERGADLPFDGAWHRIVVAVPSGDFPLQLAPAKARIGLSRRDVQIVNAWLDDFEWTDDAPTPIVDGPSRVSAGRVADVPVTELPPFLTDPTARVRAIALSRVPKEATDLEPIVTARTTEIDPAVAREAVRALGRLGTPTALATLRRILLVGPTESARQAAARELAKTGDPTLIPTIAILLGRQSWRTRLAGVEALGAFRQENAVRFRLSATLQENPELRLAALRTATTTNADERQKLLYAAINDPSDEIRALASDKLLDSTDPADVTEGGRAAADDSPWTRLLFQRALSRRANPAFRALALKGVVDPVGPVRAAALGALGTMGPIDLAEIETALSNSHPDVLLALLDLQRAGAIKLPQTTIALIMASPDARVATRRQLGR